MKILWFVKTCLLLQMGKSFFWGSLRSKSTPFCKRFFVMVLILNAQFSNAKNLEFVKNVKDNYLVFDANLNALVPLVDNTLKHNSVYFFAHKNESINHYFQIKSFIPFSLFVQGKLFSTYTAGTHMLSVQELFQMAPFNKEIAVTLHSTKNINSIQSVELFKYVHHTQYTQLKGQAPVLGFRNRNTEQKNRYITGIIYFLIILILLKIVLPDFFARVFSAMPQVESLFERTSSKLRYYLNESIFFAFIVSFIIGIFCYIFADKFYILNRLNLVQIKSSFYSFLLGFGLTLVCFLFKFFINKVISLIFSVNNFANILTYEFTKTVFQLLIVLGPVYLYVLSPFNQFHLDFTRQVIYPFVLLVVVFVLKELYYFFKLFNFNKFYLIAYICICDLFPTCILLKTLTQIELI